MHKKFCLDCNSWLFDIQNPLVDDDTLNWRKPEWAGKSRLYRRTCGENFEWISIGEMKRIDQTDIERCSRICDTLPCLYFNFQRSNGKYPNDISIGACSLFGRDYEPQLTYCWKKGIAYNWYQSRSSLIKTIDDVIRLNMI